MMFGTVYRWTNKVTGASGIEMTKPSYINKDLYKWDAVPIEVAFKQLQTELHILRQEALHHGKGKK